MSAKKKYQNYNTYVHFSKRQTQIINSFKIRISDIHKRLNHIGKYVKNSYLSIAEKNDKGMLCFKKNVIEYNKSWGQ